MGVGAASFAIGIVLAGSRTTKVLGEEITSFDSIKAFSSKTGSAVAILIASVLKIPVSTSHCTFGAICGAGLAEKLTKMPVNFEMGKIKSIVFVWIIKIPFSMFGAIFVFYEFKGVFQGYEGFDKYW